jgi:hypothetical protein
MRNFLNQYKTYIIGIVLGAFAGFFYWWFVGCSSGSCPITSLWYNTMAYGMIIGALLGSSKRGKEKLNNPVEKNIVNKEDLRDVKNH